MFQRAILALTAVILSTAYASAKDLIRNGGFEEEAPGVPPGFCMWGAEEFKKPENYTRDTDDPHSGKACLRIFHPANTRGYIISSPSDNVVKWKLDASYTFSFWAKTDKPGIPQTLLFPLSHHCRLSRPAHRSTTSLSNWTRTGSSSRSPSSKGRTSLRIQRHISALSFFRPQ